MQTSEALYRSKWSQQRVEHMKYRLERVYGPGMRDLRDEKGKVRVERLGWANKVHQKLKGTQITIQVGPITLNAGGDNAWYLGFVEGMTYSLQAEEDQIEAQLSNCFASMYGLLESQD